MIARDYDCYIVSNTANKPRETEVTQVNPFQSIYFHVKILPALEIISRRLLQKVQMQEEAINGLKP